MLYHGGGTFGTSSWISLYSREDLSVSLKLGPNVDLVRSRASKMIRHQAHYFSQRKIMPDVGL